MEGPGSPKNSIFSPPLELDSKIDTTEDNLYHIVHPKIEQPETYEYSKSMEDLQQENKELKELSDEALALLLTIFPEDHFEGKNQEPYLTIEKVIELLKRVLVQREDTKTFEVDIIDQEETFQIDIKEEEPNNDPLEEGPHSSLCEYKPTTKPIMEKATIQNITFR